MGGNGDTNQITRRAFMGAAGAAGALAATTPFARAANALVERAVATAPAGSDLEAIEHVVIVMQENRSFDHYFGTYPGVRGFDDHGSDLGVFAQAWPGGKAPKLLPYKLDAATVQAQCAGNDDLPDHNWFVQHDAWAKGRNNRWVIVHSQHDVDGAAQGPLVMGYYDRDNLPLHWALADAFTICDGYYSSVIGPTMPNRLYALSSTIDPSGKDGGPIVWTPGFAQAVDFYGTCTWKTTLEALSENGIAWKTYQPPGSASGPGQKNDLGLGFNALLYFKQFVEDPNSELYQRAFLPAWPDDFAADVANKTLPAVSWIIPAVVDSEHPSAPPTNGAAHIARVLSTLMADEELWSKTVVFLTYDENGGFFDHVKPPVAPAGTPGEFLTAKPLPAHSGGVTGPIGLGFRVPTLVISPFSRGGHVNSDTFDHTSLSRFLEARFGIKAPNMTDWRRKTVGDLTSTLSFGSPDFSAFVPPSLIEKQKELADWCPANQSPASLLGPAPKLDVHVPQTMPKQETKIS